jgi:hypothetical protein
MVSRWTAPGGWTIQLADEAGQHIYRVTRWHGWFIGYPRDVLALQAMLARSHVRLEDLTEDPADTGGLIPLLLGPGGPSPPP